MIKLLKFWLIVLNFGLLFCGKCWVKLVFFVDNVVIFFFKVVRCFIKMWIENIRNNSNINIMGICINFKCSKILWFCLINKLVGRLVIKYYGLLVIGWINRVWEVLLILNLFFSDFWFFICVNSCCVFVVIGELVVKLDRFFNFVLLLVKVLLFIILLLVLIIRMVLLIFCFIFLIKWLKKFKVILMVEIL